MMLMMPMIMWRLHLKHSFLWKNRIKFSIYTVACTKCFACFRFYSICISARWRLTVKSLNRFWYIWDLLLNTEMINARGPLNSHTITLIFHSAGDTRIHLKFPICMQRGAAAQIDGEHRTRFALAAIVIIIFRVQIESIFAHRWFLCIFLVTFARCYLPLCAASSVLTVNSPTWAFLLMLLLCVLSGLGERVCSGAGGIKRCQLLIYRDLNLRFVATPVLSFEIFRLLSFNHQHSLGK